MVQAFVRGCWHRSIKEASKTADLLVVILKLASVIFLRLGIGLLIRSPKGHGRKVTIKRGQVGRILRLDHGEESHFAMFINVPGGGPWHIVARLPLCQGTSRCQQDVIPGGPLAPLPENKVFHERRLQRRTSLPLLLYTTPKLLKPEVAPLGLLLFPTKIKLRLLVTARLADITQ